VTEIRRLHDGGLGYKRISKLFGVHEQTVAHVVRRDTWAHVP
jgi:IS30 family transposase